MLFQALKYHDKMTGIGEGNKGDWYKIGLYGAGMNEGRWCQEVVMDDEVESLQNHLYWVERVVSWEINDSVGSFPVIKAWF